MRVAVVVNSAAGGLPGEPDGAAAIAERLAAVGIQVVLREEEGDLLARLEKAKAAEVDAVVVGGGDGTMSCAAGVLAGTEVALGMLPLGTMNMLARDLGVPLELEAAIAALAQGSARRIDVAEVNGEPFLRSSVFGFPAGLAVRREVLRRRTSVRGWLGFAAAMLRALHRYPALRLTLHVDGRRLKLRTRLLVIANNAFDEELGHVLTRSRPDRGELVLYHSGRPGLRGLLRLAVGLLLGDWRRTLDLETRGVRRAAGRRDWPPAAAAGNE